MGGGACDHNPRVPPGPGRPRMAAAPHSASAHSLRHMGRPTHDYRALTPPTCNPTTFRSSSTMTQCNAYPDSAAFFAASTSDAMIAVDLSALLEEITRPKPQGRKALVCRTAILCTAGNIKRLHCIFVQDGDRRGCRSISTALGTHHRRATQCPIAIRFESSLQGACFPQDPVGSKSTHEN